MQGALADSSLLLEQQMVRTLVVSLRVSTDSAARVESTSEPDGSLNVICHGPTDLRFTLHPKQRSAFETQATELLYGGAAGGGKSAFMRMAAIIWCHLLPGLQVYLFRRTHPDLEKNHMQGPGAFPVLLAPWVASGYARINYSSYQIHIGESQISLCHLQHHKNIYNYQGAEIHVLLMDELTHFLADEYAYLRGRVRMIGLTPPPALRGCFPRIIAGSNPGGIGHNWVKADWIDPQPEGVTWQAARVDGGMRRQFIRAQLQDNPSMLQDDPEYEARLAGLGDPVLVRAMRDGDWNIIAGGFLDDLWRDGAAHVLAPFRVPDGWRIDRSFDWGSSRPFSVCWWAESDGSPAQMANGTMRHFPRGTLVLIAEWYGWNGQSNEGLRLSDPEIARGITERERTLPELAGRVIHAGPADPSIFDARPREINGITVEVSIATEFERCGVRWERGVNAPGSRVQSAAKVRQLLKAARQDPQEEAGLFVFDTCRQFIRTVPVLPRDARNRDDVDTEAEDHIWDATRYRVMTIRQRTAKAAGRRRSMGEMMPEFVRGW